MCEDGERVERTGDPVLSALLDLKPHAVCPGVSVIYDLFRLRNGSAVGSDGAVLLNSTKKAALITGCRWQDRYDIPVPGGGFINT